MFKKKKEHNNFQNNSNDKEDQIKETLEKTKKSFLKNTFDYSSNWSKLSKRDISEDIKYRDVHGTQQLERSDIGKNETFFWRKIILWTITIFTFLTVYGLWSFVDYLLARFYHKIPNASYLLNGLLHLGIGKIATTLIFTSSLWLYLYIYLKRQLVVQNMATDVTDINQHKDDQHIALVEEIQRELDWFPDIGATSDVQVSTLISHVALSPKGLKNVNVIERYAKDGYDQDGYEVYKGEIIYDENGYPKFKAKNIIDQKLMDELYSVSGVPNDNRFRKYYGTKSIPYNPGGKNRDKLKYETIEDLINNDWQLPDYEPQRPAGAYLVDTAPTNTLVVAMTRAGKGQGLIEPTIDMWSRERAKNNAVINDPKGELLVKFYARLATRGFQVVQFNLINPLKTDIYNPLGLAAQAAREGDTTKCAAYVENIANVFFPLDGGDDPVWANAANNAFKRTAYGLIDFYLEEEKKLREKAYKEKMKQDLLNQKLDEMWANVTLYNCYQMFVEMASKKIPSPVKKVETVKAHISLKQEGITSESDLKAKLEELKDKKDKDSVDKKKNLLVYQEQADLEKKYYDMSEDELIELRKDFEEEIELFQGASEIDFLTLFFNSTDALPKNSMRTLVANANNSLKSMAGAEKMLSSVYGIAVTAMSFFADPTISSLTSGPPSQNVDLAGFSFPRRIGVRFSATYMKKTSLLGQHVKWSAYADPEFKENLGKEFEHSDLIGRTGWAKYMFKGIFPKEVAYIKLEIIDFKTKMLVKTFRFKFTKSYKKNLDGRYYVKDPVLNEKIVQDGKLEELIERKVNGKTTYEKGITLIPVKKLKMARQDVNQETIFAEEVKVPVIISSFCKYNEKSKFAFLVTPPHLLSYAKLILILIKQLVDLNFDQSYLTKSSQKPLYKTRYMLDELGNLQSEGHGISGLETMLSIGLGQEQQFTLILQTLQQLRNVYGESSDKIIQGNTSNIIFLKSTDNDMIEELSQMSGTTHRVYSGSKTIVKDMSHVYLKNAKEVSVSMSAEKEQVISYNDLAFIGDRNSVVFRAGGSPIWNKNETILPMSWKLFQNTISVPGEDYTLQNIPSLSSVMEFDVRKNKPDFEKMLKMRVAQATKTKRAKEAYKEGMQFEEIDISRLDPDEYSDDVMLIINQYLSPINSSEETYGDPEEDFEFLWEEKDVGSNKEFESEVAKGENEKREKEKIVIFNQESKPITLYDFDRSSSGITDIFENLLRFNESRFQKAMEEIGVKIEEDKANKQFRYLYNGELLMSVIHDGAFTNDSDINNEETKFAAYTIESKKIIFRKLILNINRNNRQDLDRLFKDYSDATYGNKA